MNYFNFEFKDLEIFIKVVELQSFTKAARAVYLAQASVSERILNLERNLGIKLLDRLGRKVVPTKAGEIFYRKALKLLQMKTNVQLEMAELLGSKKGEILIGASTIPGEYIFPKIIREFNRRFPNIRLNLQVSDSKIIEEKVIDGEIELGVIGFKSAKKEILNYKLWKDELVLAVPFDHPLSKAKSIKIKDILQEPFIIRERGSGTLKYMEEYLKRSDAKTLEKLKIKAILGSSTAVKEAIKEGYGISILSNRAIETELQMGLISTVKLEKIKMERFFYLIKDKRRGFSPLSKSLYQFLISYKI